MWTGVLLGTLGTLSSESWPTIWLILEVNLMSFMPLISVNWRSKKNTIVYFIVQRLGSLIILIRGMLTDLLSFLAPIGILLKSSLAPLHYWGPLFVTNLSNLLCFIFLTWQKIGPIFLLVTVRAKYNLLLYALLNLYIALGGLGSKRIVLLLFFSRLLHIRWFLMSTGMIGIKYFLFYIVITFPILLTKSPCIPLLMMNMGGVPPLTGFIMKIMVLQSMRIFVGGMFLFFSLLLLFAYARTFLNARRNPLNATSLSVCLIGMVF